MMLNRRQHTANTIPSVASMSTVTVSGTTVDLNSLSGVPSNEMPSASGSN